MSWMKTAHCFHQEQFFVRQEDCCARLQMSNVCCLLTVMCTESEHITMTWIKPDNLVQLHMLYKSK